MNKVSKIRLDIHLLAVYENLTRSQIRDFIKSGKVSVNGKVQTKPGFLVSETDIQNESLKIDIQNESELSDVGRGARKLRAGLKALNIEGTSFFNQKICLDAGASTGGFSQVMLENQCARVYAIDVGTEQLDPRLKKDPRIISMEGVNLKHPFALEQKCQRLVFDVSYISILKILPQIIEHLSLDAEGVGLIKPQFEALEIHEVLGTIENNIGLLIDQTVESPLRGKSGQLEYFIYFKRKQEVC